MEDIILGCEFDGIVFCLCLDGLVGIQFCNVDGMVFGFCDCEVELLILGFDCINKVDYMFCDDGDLCIQGDYCLVGVCVVGFVLNCQDDNVCIDNGCDFVEGCFFNVNIDSCNDGNSCTKDDQCNVDVC